MKAKLFLFLLGALVGFLVAVLFQPLLRPLVTEAFRDEGDATEGRVVGKRLQGERLLLTVDAAEGTVLATFKNRVPEIDMLVEEGDLLKLGVPRYEPFVEDPPILAVRKQEMPTGREEEPGVGAEVPRPDRPSAGIIPGRAEPPGTEPRGREPDAGEPPPPAGPPAETAGEEPNEAEPPGPDAPEAPPPAAGAE